MPGVYENMEITDFENLLESQGFSGGLFVHASHYSGENIGCAQYLSSATYRYVKFDDENNVTLIQAQGCSETDTNANKTVLESQPVKMIYEKI